MTLLIFKGMTMLPVLNGSVAGVGLSPNDGFNHNQLYIYIFVEKILIYFKKSSFFGN
jgi:hypothetical protein